MARRSFDLLLVSLVSAYAMILTLASVDVGVLRAAAGIPLVLFAPGYAIVAAVFPEPAPDRHGRRGAQLGGRAERLALSVGLSMAVAALIGLALNLTPWGLRSSSWAVVLTMVTVAACAVAAWRRQGYPVATSRRVSVPPLQTVLLLSAAAIVVVAGTVAWWGAEHERFRPYTQFWIVPAGTSGFDLGIRNFESGSRSYIVRVRTAPGSVHQLPVVRLPRGARWGAHGAVSPRLAEVTVLANLYLASRPAHVYRHVRLHLFPHAGQKVTRNVQPGAP